LAISALPVALVAAVVLDVFKVIGDRQYKRRPFRILRLARQILPPEPREIQYEQSWLPEPHHILEASTGGELRRRSWARTAPT
jgi:hypothetical protein